MKSEDFATFLKHIETQLIDPAITLLSLMAFVLFVWGGVQFIRSSDDTEKRSVGQMHMLWGIVGLVIVFGANAIIGILKSIVGA